MTEKRITLRAAHNISSALVLLRAATLGVNRYAGKGLEVAPQKGQSELSQSEQSQNELSSRVQDKTVQVAVSTSEHAGVSTLATAPAVSAHDSSAPTEPVVTAKESSTSSAVSTAAQAGSSEVKSSRSNTKPKSQASVSDASTATESHARKSKLEESTPKYENGIRVLPGKPQPASAATPASASSAATASAATGTSVTAKAVKAAKVSGDSLEANTDKSVSSSGAAKKQSAAKNKARNSTKHKSADPSHTISPNATHSLAADLSNLLSDDAVIGAPTSSLIRTGGALGLNNQSLEIGSAPVAITPASITKVGDKAEESAVETTTTAATATALAASTVVVSNAASSAAASTAASASEDSGKSQEHKEKLDAASGSHKASGEHSSKVQSSIEPQEASSAETLAPQDKHVAVKQHKAPDTKAKDKGSEVAPESDSLLGTPSSSLLEQSSTLDFGQGQNTVLISSSGVGLASVASSGFASSLELTPAVAESPDKDLVLGVETEPLEQALRINTGNAEADKGEAESNTGLKLTPASVEFSTGLTGVETQDVASDSLYNAESSEASADSSATLAAATVAPASTAAADAVGDSALSSTSPENKVAEKSNEPLELTPASVIPSADLSDAADSVTAKDDSSKTADAAVAADADMSVPEDDVVAKTEESSEADAFGSLELTSASVGAEHAHETLASSSLTTTPVTASAAATVAQDNALEELKAQEPEDLGAGAAIPSSNEVEQLVENGSGADDSALVLSPVADAPVQALSSAEDLGSPISAASAADAAATVNAAASVGLDSAFGSLEESVIGAHSSSDLLAGASLGLSSLDLSALSKPLIQPAASGSPGSAEGGLLQAKSDSQEQKDGQSGGLVLTPVASAVK
ncbi:MAG TPA: hypothetical protein H9850_06300 [Candidatus Anaerobiospirillum pullistercoris]|uniref:Uncharacterized protein n=1 Tax=Candidatus Anaerobiospirillum pullistercoris TaxID=2838452 RepID=A0A9D1WDQ8_9GAMM|nr:hypothetical protein [Candidatus Anaerobiospirillum pullistercoris]